MAGDYSENINNNQQYHYTSEQLSRLNNDDSQYQNQHQKQHQHQYQHQEYYQQPHTVDIEQYHPTYVFLNHNK